MTLAGRRARRPCHDRRAAPGTYPVAFPPAGTSAGAGALELTASAVDEIGQTSQMSRSFVLDDTLGFLRAPRSGRPAAGRELPIAWRLARPARVSVTILDSRGALVRRLLGAAGWTRATSASSGTASAERRAARRDVRVRVVAAGRRPNELLAARDLRKAR